MSGANQTSWKPATPKYKIRRLVKKVDFEGIKSQ